MKFRNLGQILMASVVSVGLCLGVTSCSNSFTVGWLYTIGTSTTNQTSGQITGFGINNNTGQLSIIKNSPFGSGGANPIRAVVYPGGRFLYVLNAMDGVTGNIALFTIGGRGVLSYQQTYNTQGNVPISIAADGSGHMYALDKEVHDANGNIINDGNGAITAFSVDNTTGRLSLITNQQVIDNNGNQLNYFPVGVGPTMFGPIANSAIVGGYLYTVDADQSVFPYALNPTSGQLTVTQNGPQPTGALRISAIGGNSSFVYLMDAGTTPSTIMPYTRGNNGSLQTVVGGNYPNDATTTNPSDLVFFNNKFVYIANAGPNTNPSQSSSAISAYSIIQANGQLAVIGGEPFPSGSSPRCILVDPSSQYVYTANFSDSTVTGSKIDTQAGVLTALPRGSSFPTTGQPTWCVTSGVTQ